MNKKQFKEILDEDLKRNGNNSLLWSYFTSSCFKIIFWYRVCKYFESKKSRYIAPLWYLSRLHYSRKCTKYGCDIPSHCQIGAGLVIAHINGIVINGRCIIGKNFTIRSGCVIRETDKGVPIIGDNVCMGIHSMILGNVTISDCAKIGAGAIVTHDVPRRGIVIGSAAHLHRIE